MFPNDPYPFLSRTSGLTVVFVIAIIVFHVIFVYWPKFRLTEIGWKRSDYVWVAVAALGLVGAAGHTRQLLAKDRLSLSEARVDGQARIVHDLVASYSNPTGPACSGPFADSTPPSHASTNPVVHDYGAVCQWSKDLASRMQSFPARAVIAPGMLPPDPQYFGSGKSSVEPYAIIRDIKSQISFYNAEAQAHDTVLKAAGPSTSEETLEFLAPMLLAVTLAFRFTKASGEIRLKQRK